MIFLRIALALALAACALASHAQIAFRAAATAVAASGATGTIAYGGVGNTGIDSGNCPQSATPTLPAGTAAGDMLILTIASKDDNPITVSGSWNSLYADIQGTTYQVAIYWKLAATGETAPTVSKTGTTCNVMLTRISRFTNVDTVTPFEGGVGASYQNATNVVTGSITTTVATDMLVIVAASGDDSDTAVPGGFTEPWESVTTTGTDVSIGLKYQLQAAAGVKGAYTFAKTKGADPNHGVLFALRPRRASLTINVPAGTAANDVMVATIAVANSTVVITPPAGWTSQPAVLQAAGNGSRQQIFYRIASGAEPASYTWIFESAHVGAAGAIASYSGVDTTSPIDVYSGGNTTPQGADSNLQHRALGVTTTTVDSMVISTHSFSSSASWTPPAGMTERVDINSQGGASPNGVSLAVDEVAQPSAGATGDKLATASGNGDTGVAQIIVLRTKFLAPVLELTMDQASWNGTAGEVTDSSGSGLNGQAFNSATTAGATPAIAGNPGTCRYGSFDGTNQYVQVASSAPLNITDELTVMAWVKANSLPTAGNLKSILSKDNNYEFHLNSTGKVDWWWGGGALELISATSVATGAWTHIAIVYSRAGAYQRIYINGVQDANTNNQAAALTTTAVPLQIAADQNFAGRYWDGLIDEVRIFPQALGPGRIAQYMNTTRPCAALVDHYSIGHAGTGIACVDQTITISAHDSSHAAVDAGGATITLTTSNGKGSWVGIATGSGALNDPTAGDGSATYTFAAGETNVKLLFRYANLAATSETFGFNVTDSVHTESTGSAVALTDDPSFTMSQSGFLFRNVTDGTTIIPAQISGKPSNTGYNAKTIRLQAVKTDTNTGSCTPLFASQSRTVQLGAECNSPSACAGGAVFVNATAIPTSNDNGGSGAASYGNVSLAFNASSEADTVITYPDAGQISLHARYDLDSAVAGFEMLGGSNAFVVRPFGLSFSGMQHANSASGTWFKAAGDNFTMALTARQWAAGQDANNDGVPDSTANISGNGTTPNYAATATVAATSNPAGVAGAVSRGATCAGAASIALSGGTATANDWCYSEVGNVLLTASATNYLGSGQDVTGTSGLDGDANGPYVGRFSPKKFVLVGSPSLTPRTDLACAGSAFTYMDETMRLAFKVEARNAQDVVTANYSTAGGYAKVNNAAAWGFGARSGTTDLSSRIDTGGTLAGSWVNGVADMTFNTVIRRLDPTPDGPYAALHFGIAPTDTEPSMTYDLNVDNAGGNDHKDLGLVADVRFGRMRLDNVLGSEARQLPVPMRVEYWNSGGFTTNTDDSCTAVPKSAISLDFTPVSNLTACETMVSSGPLTFSAGVAPLVLTKPGAGNSGSVVLTVNLTGASGNYCNAVGAAAVPTVASPTPLPYLAGRWNDGADGDGVPATLYDDKPSARAAFGIYGSQPGNFIYFRERFD